MDELGIPSLSEDLLRMLRDPDFSDMVFVCGDGVEVPACRMLVAARSPVLHTMLLTSGMVESRRSRVMLESITGSAMRICLEFLYTDHVRDVSLQPMALDEVMEAVIAAARFFLLPGLERCCIDFCTHALDNLSTCPRPIEELFQAHNLGAQLYHDHPQKNMSDLLHKFGDIFEAALNQELESYQLLSEQGCLHLLANLKPPMALREYHLLVHAIRWCASTSILISQNVQVQKLLDELLPSSETRILAVLEGGQQDPPTHVDNIKLIKVLADPLASLLDKFPLDLSKIPSTILSRILEPLDIIPCSKFLAAYRIRALPQPDLRWDAWGLHEKYIISPSDPTEISCATFIKGFARCSTCIMASHYLFFEWEVTILEACCASATIGFCLASQARSSMAGSLGIEEGTVGFNIYDGDVYHYGNLISEACPPYQRAMRIWYDEFKDHERLEDFIGITFGVHIQLLTGVCTLKIRGKKIGESIEIPAINKGVYPAITLQGGTKARIRVVSYA